MKAAKVDFEPFWPGLFAKALGGADVGALLSAVGSGGGGGGGGAAPAAGGGGAAPAEAAAAAPAEEEEEEDDGMEGFGE